MAAIAHPNIVQIIGIVMDNPAYFALLMEVEMWSIKHCYVAHVLISRFD